MAQPCLPTELIELIASHLDLATNRSLRLASSELSRQTAHHFKSRYLRKQTLKWDRENLDVFLETNTHETLGGALQHLLIDATPYHSISLWEESKRLSEEQARSTCYPNTGSRELNEQHTADRDAAAKAAIFFNESRYDLKCLKTVFAALEKLESITFEYGSMDKKYAKFGSRYCVSSQHEMSRPFVSTMAAIAATHLPVSTIALNKERNYGTVSIGRLESLAPSLAAFDGVFEKLHTLHLSLRDWRNADDGFALDDTARAPFVVRFLAKAKNVQDLDLSCYSNFEYDVFGQMARHCRFSKLKTCKLAMFPINVHSTCDLEDFLAPSKDTLTELRLYHMLLPGRDPCWPALVADLARSDKVLQKLEVLCLSNLFASEGHKMWMAGGLWTCFGDRGVVGEWRQEILDSGLYEARGSKAVWENTVGAYPFEWRPGMCNRPYIVA